MSEIVAHSRLLQAPSLQKQRILQGQQMEAKLAWYETAHENGIPTRPPSAAWWNTLLPIAVCFSRWAGRAGVRARATSGLSSALATHCSSSVEDHPTAGSFSGLRVVARSRFAAQLRALTSWRTSCLVHRAELTARGRQNLELLGRELSMETDQNSLQVREASVALREHHMAIAHSMMATDSAAFEAAMNRHSKSVNQHSKSVNREGRRTAGSNLTRAVLQWRNNQQMTSAKSLLSETVKSLRNEFLDSINTARSSVGASDTQAGQLLVSSRLQLQETERKLQEQSFRSDTAELANATIRSELKRTQSELQQVQSRNKELETAVGSLALELAQATVGTEPRVQELESELFQLKRATAIGQHSVHRVSEGEGSASGAVNAEVAEIQADMARMQAWTNDVKSSMLTAMEDWQLEKQSLEEQLDEQRARHRIDVHELEGMQESMLSAIADHELNTKRLEIEIQRLHGIVELRADIDQVKCVLAVLE